MGDLNYRIDGESYEKTV